AGVSARDISGRGVWRAAFGADLRPHLVQEPEEANLDAPQLCLPAGVDTPESHAVPGPYAGLEGRHHDRAAARL
ncbi:hypothetical protein HaLaN_25201, partial [Haematococcus lacustris]